ncbi:MAG TPA: DNA-directed RNA polymerase subunit omega [Acidobacteriaceae bacterium]|jgi:DNA-directed RNA polymerase subunit omega|nr:DNA-directed RNA polymerase subunit omega [Acidobacteriaceae bacterium]
MAIEREYDSNFRYVLVAARRARQLQNGAEPLVQSRSRKACRVAQEEIAAGKVAYVKKEDVPVVRPEVEAPDIPKFAS